MVFSREQWQGPAWMALAIGVVIFLALLGLRAGGALEGLELAAYDGLLTLRPARPSAHSPVVLIGISEEDIHELGGWPLPDETLARALTILAAAAPAAVGVDLYRDLPVPPGRAELEKVVLANPNVVLIMKFGDRHAAGVPAPEFLNETEQTGFSDLAVDPGGVVRRGLLFLDDGVTLRQSLAFRLATLYLAGHGIAPEPDPLVPEHLRFGRVTLPPLPAKAGGYVNTDLAGYQFLLDFQEPTASFPTYSLAALLAGRIEAAALRGKIVILGTMATSMHDIFFTAVNKGGDPGEMTPGMSVHGHAASQLLRFALDGDRPMAVPGQLAAGGWILLWSLLGGGLSLRLRSPLPFFLGAVGGALAIAALGQLAINRNYWIPVVPPLLAWLGTAGLVTAYLSHEEKKNRAALMEIFSRHVSEEVAGSLWQQRRQFLDHGRPLPQRLTATVLFTDLVGFTSIAEKLAPQELMLWLNEYMEAMGREVMAHEGIINKYIGDAIMALFGVPVARTTAAEIGAAASGAVRCAQAMAVALRELNQSWAARGLPTVGTRIGIFTGPVIAGSLGSSKRLEYTVLGDTVNIASRLESTAKDSFAFHPLRRPCRILIGDATREYLGADFPVRLIGDLTLKGKERQIRVFEVEAESAGELGEA